MLTEIEWWGGVIFLWWAACYWLTIKSYEGNLTVDAASSHIAFALSAAVLALYFYPLESMLVKKLYMGALAIGVVAVIVVIAWPGTEEDDIDNKKSTGCEEDEKEYTWLGYLIFLFPMLVSFSLGAVKSFGFVKELGWLG